MNEIPQKMQKELDKIQENLITEENELYAKDQTFLESLKLIVTPDYFEKIEYQLNESEHPSNYRFVTVPIGSRQNEGDCLIWVNQSCGYFGDEFSGTICMRISDKKYFMWDYYMN